MNYTAVYAALIPDVEEIGDVLPEERQAEIDRCSSPKVKREKYYVWKLLEYAFERDLGERLEDISFEKNGNGKWTSDKAFFSLSHTDGVVAVAVSRSNVGVDVEAVRRHRDGLEAHILTERERTELSTLEESAAWEYIIGRWTQKESIFKTFNARGFEPKRIEASEYPTRTERLALPVGVYMLSVCAQDVDNVRIEMVDLF